MTNNKWRWIAVFIGAMIILAGSVRAFERLPGPLKEAIEACKEKSEDTAVEITTPMGDKIKATCKLVDDQMVAVPEGGFRSPKGMPSNGK